MKIVDLVTPGQEFLTEDAVCSLCEWLEVRVQCSGVSCGEVHHLNIVLDIIVVQMAYRRRSSS